VKGAQAMHRTATMCRTLGVSASGYWARAKRLMSEREQTDRAIEAQIREIHHWSQGTYGAPGCTLSSALGDACGPKRVARLMRRSGLQVRRGGES
jgi:hypothetical protein